MENIEELFEQKGKCKYSQIYIKHQKFIEKIKKLKHNQDHYEYRKTEIKLWGSEVENFPFFRRSRTCKIQVGANVFQEVKYGYTGKSKPEFIQFVAGELKICNFLWHYRYILWHENRQHQGKNKTDDDPAQKIICRVGKFLQQKLGHRRVPPQR